MSHRSFLARWTILTMLGLALGAFAGFGLAGPLEMLVGMMLVTPTVMAVIGCSTGGSQYLLVRRRLKRPLWWVAASALGLSIGLTAGVVLVEHGSRAIAGRPISLNEVTPLIRALSFAVTGMVGGMFLGTGQWSVLRGDTAGAGAWILATMLGLSAGLMLGSLLADFISGGVTTPLGFATLLLTAGCVFGIFTGKSLIAMAAGLSPRS